MEPETVTDSGWRWEPDTGLDPRRRERNNRLLLRWLAVAGVAVLALGAVGVVLIRHFLDEATGTDAAVSATYQRQYRECVLEFGRSAQRSCAERAERHCLADPRWTRLKLSDSALLDRMSSVCLFGPDRHR